MAAPTNAAKREKVLANTEPSTHGTKATSQLPTAMSGIEGVSRPIADIAASPNLTRSSHTATAFDHPVGARDHRQRYVEAERL
jgi:hypothetical protein